MHELIRRPTSRYLALRTSEMERHLNAEGKRKVTGTQGGQQLCLDDDARRVFLGISLSTHGPIYILNTLLHPGSVPSLPRDNGHAQKSCNVLFD